MKVSGQLKKMISDYSKPIEYYLPLSDDILMMNQHIGKEITLKHTAYECFNCNKNIPIFAMGYCYNCYNIVPQTNQSIIRPELATAHLGIEEKNLEWEKALQLQPHIVYLANTGGIKVGVTRKTQIPTRWIDQGATQTIAIIEVENRYLAGITEIELAKVIADKTNYKKMLSQEIPNFDMIEWKHKMIRFLPKETQEFVIEKDEVFYFQYPIEKFPAKIQSTNFKKEPLISGVLAGIKGQYLIFEDGKVLNIRSHEGYKVEVEIR